MCGCNKRQVSNQRQDNQRPVQQQFATGVREEREFVEPPEEVHLDIDGYRPAPPELPTRGRFRVSVLC